MFSTRATLKQGSWGVPEQFEYSWVIPNDADMAAYFSVFRMSFAVAGFIHHDKTNFPDIPTMTVHSPGFWIPIF